MTEPLDIPPLAPPLADSAPGAEPGAQRGVGAVAIVLLAIVNTWASIAVYHAWIAPEPVRIAVVDVATIYREQEAAFTRMVTEGTVTDIERVRALDRAEAFARRLPVALDELSDSCRCVLVPANAVAGRYGVTDHTDTLRRMLAP